MVKNTFHLMPISFTWALQSTVCTVPTLKLAISSTNVYANHHETGIQYVQ